MSKLNGKIQSIVSLFEALDVQKNFFPSQKINSLFTALVRQVEVRTPYDQYVMANSTIQSIAPTLRSLCAKGEYAMEFYWAKCITRPWTSSGVIKKFNEFWYKENYQKLIKFETGLLEKTGYFLHPTSSVVVVGGGPLPLTAIFLAKYYACHITVLDQDKKACALAKQVIKRLHLSSLIDVVETAGEAYQKYATHDVIIVASLAGAEDTKKYILQHIHKTMAFEARVVVRSATGLRTLLYSPVLPDMLADFIILLHEDPSKEIINCAYICTR